LLDSLNSKKKNTKEQQIKQNFTSILVNSSLFIYFKDEAILYANVIPYTIAILI